MFVLLVYLLTAYALLGQAPSGSGKQQNPFTEDPEAIEAGRQVFLETCSACHGASGEGGRGPSLLRSREVRRASDRQLFSSVRNGIPGTDMPPFPFPNSKIWRVIAFVRSLTAPAFDNKAPGDVEAGRALFFGKGDCAGCHMIRGRGGFLGPDLSDVGVQRTLGQLREAILDPNKSVAEGFEGVVLTTGAGRQIKGVAKYRTNYAIRVFDESGEMHAVRGEDLRRVKLQKESWMPPDYGERLTEAEIQDLLAFLSRQSTRGKDDE